LGNNEGFVLIDVAKENLPVPFFGEEILEAYKLTFNQFPDREFAVYRFRLNPRHDPIANTLTEKKFLWQVMDMVHGIPLLIPSLTGLQPYTQLSTKWKAIETANKLFQEFKIGTTDSLEAILRAFFMVRNNYELYLRKTSKKMEAA